MYIFVAELTFIRYVPCIMGSKEVDIMARLLGRLRLLRPAFVLLLALVLLLSKAQSQGTVGSNVSPNPSYTYKVCSPWSCEEAGITCRSIRGVCGWSWDYPCLTKLQVYDCERSCQRIQNGEVVDTWVETEVKYQHIGCCNICVMRHGVGIYRLWPGGIPCVKSEG